MEVPLARRKIDRRDRIAAAALLVPPAGIVQLNHALHNKLQLNIYSIGDQNAFSTTFFFPFLFFSSPLPLFRSGYCCCTPAKLFIGGLLAQIPFISISLDRDREFFSTSSLFFFFPPSIYITYHVGTSVSVFFGGSMRPSHFKFLRLRSFVFVFQI